VRFKSGINESDLPSSPREKGVNPDLMRAMPSSPREKGVNPELMSSSSLLLREKGVNTEFTNFFLILYIQYYQLIVCQVCHSEKFEEKIEYILRIYQLILRN